MSPTIPAVERQADGGAEGALNPKKGLLHRFTHPISEPNAGLGAMTAIANTDASVRLFVRETFGPLGTLKLHRHAIGLDLLRAPLNVALAPVFLLTRLSALLCRLFRMPRAANWLGSRRILLPTRVSQEVGKRVTGLIRQLSVQGALKAPDGSMAEHAIADYAGVRSAVAEITTTCIILVIGYLIFQTATPGIISMAAPVAEMQAHQRAVEGFWAGQRLGRAYYGVFGTHLTVWQVVGTGVVLAMGASLITTFAGILADPLQVLTGTHRRRLLRLLRRIENAATAPGTLEKEHIAARAADITDIVLNIWRAIRG